jgi:hypothetical protein
VYIGRSDLTLNPNLWQQVPTASSAHPHQQPWACRIPNQRRTQHHLNLETHTYLKLQPIQREPRTPTTSRSSSFARCPTTKTIGTRWHWAWAHGGRWGGGRAPPAPRYLHATVSCNTSHWLTTLYRSSRFHWSTLASPTLYHVTRHTVQGTLYRWEQFYSILYTC